MSRGHWSKVGDVDGQTSVSKAALGVHLPDEGGNKILIEVSPLVSPSAGQWISRPSWDAISVVESLVWSNRATSG